MAYTKIDGKIISSQIKSEVKTEVTEISKKGINPALAVVLVGNNPASLVYVNNKKKACEETGIKSISYELKENITQDELMEIIDELNNDKNINGILVQLPLPKHLDEEEILLKINPEKDVDGFHPYNVGLLSIGQGKLKPCTPAGIIEMLKRSNIEISGKNCVVVGRSNIVGKPISQLLLEENGTVTVCHSKTKDLKNICKSAEILVVAIGKPKFITEDMVGNGAVVIDVGIHRQENKKLCGDVDYDNCCEKASFISPVPGGVGPMTIGMLMKNCVIACKSQNKLK